MKEPTMVAMKVTHESLVNTAITGFIKAAKVTNVTAKEPTRATMGEPPP
jgi:hypothetical protein